MDAERMPAFTVLIPARLASSRLPDKPLADIGGLPMVVRVARQAQASGAARTVVAADSPAILAACRDHGVECLLTRADHACGSDRLAEACDLLQLADQDIVVNVQGDEPLVPPPLIASVARRLHERPQADIATAAHAIDSLQDFLNPNVVKVVCDRTRLALYFSRAPIAWQRDGGGAGAPALPSPPPLRHIGIYAYRVGFLRTFPTLEQSPLETTEALEQLRALWHGRRIAVFVADDAPAGGVDTPEDLARVRALFAPA